MELEGKPGIVRGAWRGMGAWPGGKLGGAGGAGVGRGGGAGGTTAIVTGASSGIGASTVRKLREAGVRVVGGARRVERIEADVALPLGGTAEESRAACGPRAPHRGR